MTNTAVLERPPQDLVNVRFDFGAGQETLGHAFIDGIYRPESAQKSTEDQQLAPSTEITDWSAAEYILRQSTLESPIVRADRFENAGHKVAKKIGAFLLLAGSITGGLLLATTSKAYAAQSIGNCGKNPMEVKDDGTLKKFTTGGSGSAKVINCANGNDSTTKDKSFKSSCDGKELAYAEGYDRGRLMANGSGCEVVEVGGSNPAAGDAAIPPSQPGVDRTSDQIKRDVLPPGYVMSPSEPPVQFNEAQKAEAARAAVAIEAAKVKVTTDAITKQDADFKCLRGRGVIDFPFIKYGDCDPEAGSWIMLIQEALNKCTELTSNHGDLYVPEKLVVDGIFGGATMRELVKRFPGRKGMLNESGQFVGVDQSLFVALINGMNCDQQPDDLSGKPNILPALNAAPKKGQITDP